MYPTPVLAAESSSATAKPFKPGGSVFDTVKVSPDTFKSVMFMGVVARTEWSDTRRQGEDKPQKFTRDGVPVWSVKVAATNWRDQSDMLSVTVAAHASPGDSFAPGQLVEFDGLTFGVTGKRDGGYVTWSSADAVVAAGQSATRSVKAVAGS